MSLDDRVRTLELVLEAALFSDKDSTARNQIMSWLQAKYLSGSCGDGAFDRTNMRAYNERVDKAVEFCKYGVLSYGG